MHTSLHHQLSSVYLDEQQQEESGLDYASVIDQMATTINVRYGNNLMEEGETFVSGNLNQQQTFSLSHRPMSFL